MDVIHDVRHALTGAEALRLCGDVAALARLDVRRLTLSLRCVDAIDASGVAALVRVFSNLRRRGVELAVADVREEVGEALRSLGLEGLVPVTVTVTARAEGTTLPPRLRRA